MDNTTPRRDPQDERLHGRLLRVAQLGWLLVSFIDMGVCIIALWLLSVDHRTFAVMFNMPELGTSSFARYYIGINAVFAAVCTLIAVIIFWRRSDEWMALLTALMIIMFGTVNHNAQIPRIVALAYPEWQLLFQLLTWVASASLLCWFYLFPNGRFAPRWTRWLLLTFLVLSPLPELIFGNESPDVVQMLAVGVPSVLLFVSVIVTQIYRYRRVSTVTQRLQTRWVMYGLALTIAGTLTVIIVDALQVARQAPFISSYALITFVYTTTLLLPLSIGFAILRSRLFDIDVIIRRTLVYSVLTFTLGLIYLGCILLSRALIAPYLGGSELAIVVSTLLIAALFFPLRRRIQNAIDRRFYRRKYDAQQVLAQFALTARDETDLARLTDELLRVVDETVQPAFVGLWLREPTTDRSPHRQGLATLHSSERPSGEPP